MGDGGSDPPPGPLPPSSPSRTLRRSRHRSSSIGTGSRPQSKVRPLGSPGIPRCRPSPGVAPDMPTRVGGEGGLFAMDGFNTRGRGNGFLAGSRSLPRDASAECSCGGGTVGGSFCSPASGVWGVVQSHVGSVGTTVFHYKSSNGEGGVFRGQKKIGLADPDPSSTYQQ